MSLVHRLVYPFNRWTLVKGLGAMKYFNTHLLKFSKCNKGFNWLMHLSKEEPANDRQSNTQDKAAQLLLYDSSI